MNFESRFEALTGKRPFPWQVELYKKFTAGRDFEPPAIANLPTGVGKTMVIAVWLLAYFSKTAAIPRRLVYVVNRRTVVDQTTTEVDKLRRGLSSIELKPDDLAVSTLRGQFADNEEWCADPSRPAVICGTVDMIGSRLLFGGYRIGFKKRPLHAGFLGQDVLLVHDESHLEPAFQKLLVDIQQEQCCQREKHGELPWPRLSVMALSATSRDSEVDSTKQAFALTNDETNPQIPIPHDSDIPVHTIWRRITAQKQIELHSCENESKLLAENIADLSLRHLGKNASVLVYARRVTDVIKIADLISKSLAQKGESHNVETLTGVKRGFEREHLVNNPVFARFMPEEDRLVDAVKGTCFLICTSAGEVGANLSADHLVCDLSTLESMMQRFGRVNRFGRLPNSKIDVVFPKQWDNKHILTMPRKRTLEILASLESASPLNLAQISADKREKAYSPEPKLLPVSSVLFDQLAMTSLLQRQPGCPAVGPYLHGIAEWEPPRTSVAWRREVDLVSTSVIAPRDPTFPRTLLDEYPLKPLELLSDVTERVFVELQKLAKRFERKWPNVWIVREKGDVDVKPLYFAAQPAVKGQEKKRLIEDIENCTVLLPPSIGGLTNEGTLNGLQKLNGVPLDVADEWTLPNDSGEREIQRKRVVSYGRDLKEQTSHNGMSLTRVIEIDPFFEGSSLFDKSEELDEDNRAVWLWYVRPKSASEDLTTVSLQPITWQHHTDRVFEEATRIVGALNLPQPMQDAIILAAKLHDLGKRREMWQRSIGNPNPENWHAKGGKPEGEKRWRPQRLSPYRHEFGSLLDVAAQVDYADWSADWEALDEHHQEIVLHLIAAHHGYARPHFTAKGMLDPEPPEGVDPHEVAADTMRRYARLQRRYGRWGLAYLESLLRAADWAASKTPSELKEAAK